MIRAHRRSLHLAAMVVTAAVAACAQRIAPPAPVTMGGEPRAGVAGRETANPGQVVVRAGETLYAISRRYDVPVRSLIEANRLEPPYRLAAGRRLTVPKVVQHVVQRGETLYSISRLNGVDTSTLARTNHLAPPYTVRIGEVLILPAPVTVAGPAPVIQATAPAAAYARPAEPAQPVPSVTASAPTPAVVASTPASVPESPATRKPAMLAPRRGAAPSVAPAPAEEAAAVPPLPPERPPSGSPPAITKGVPPERTASLPPPAAPAHNGVRTFLWPVRGHILAAFGPGPGGIQNDGINIAAAAGTPVRAADAGTVAYAGNELRGYGNLILLKHANGWMTAYAHNAALLVKRGEKVRRGQIIARVGSTGAVGEPQLHFEIRHGTRALDPSDYLPPAATAANQ